MKKRFKFFSGKKLYTLLSFSVLIFIIVIGSIKLGPVIVQTAKDPESFKNYIHSKGYLGYLIFILIQIAQVIFAFIPGEFVEIGGGYVYGAWIGLILCFIGVAIASSLIFLLTRLLGKRFTSIMLDTKDLKKLSFLNDSKKLEITLFIIYFIPGTPKDLITYFAGVTKIKFTHFLLISTFARFPSIITSTLAGSHLGKQNYITSIVIFAISAIIAAIGLLIYKKMQNKTDKQN